MSFRSCIEQLILFPSLWTLMLSAPSRRKGDLRGSAPLLFPWSKDNVSSLSLSHYLCQFYTTSTSFTYPESFPVFFFFSATYLFLWFTLLCHSFCLQILTSAFPAPWSCTISFQSWRSGSRFWKPRRNNCRSSSWLRRNAVSLATSRPRLLKLRSRENSSCLNPHTITSRLPGNNQYTLGMELLWSTV